MDTTIKQVMDELIAHLQQLNKEFENAVENQTPFAESKKIWLRIKDANAKLRHYFESGDTEVLHKTGSNGPV